MHGESEDSLAQAQAEIVVSLTGFEGSLSQTTHARHVYSAYDIQWNARLAEILVERPGEPPVLDFRRFHEIVPIAPAAARVSGRR